MATATESNLPTASNAAAPDPPTLSQSYSGIPERLLNKARNAKKLVYENQTKGISCRRIRGPVIPKGITQPLFDAAIQELQSQLGNEHVVVNDQPLVDGWYVESIRDCLMRMLTGVTGTWNVSEDRLCFQIFQYTDYLEKTPTHTMHSTCSTQKRLLPPLLLIPVVRKRFGPSCYGQIITASPYIPFRWGETVIFSFSLSEWMAG